MDYGTIISGVCEARYSSVEAIVNDAKLVAENCEKWYASSNRSTKEVARESVSYSFFHIIIINIMGKYNILFFHRIHLQLMRGCYLENFKLRYLREYLHTHKHLIIVIVIAIVIVIVTGIT